VSNTGGGTLTWAATTKGATWLTIVPTIGGVGTITVTLRPASLATGDHLDTITVAPNGWTGTSVNVPVLFKITAPPQLSVTSSSKPDTAFLGSTASKTSAIRISNSGGGSLAWTAMPPDTTWLTRSKFSGSAPPDDSTIASSSPTGLAIGTHTGHMVIDAGAVAGSPVTVTKTLVIVPCTVQPVTPDALVSASLTTADCGAPHRAGSFAKLYSVSANTGDTIDVTLSASFDAYLVVTNGAGDTVRVSNDTCPGLTGTACVRNVVVQNGMRIEATTTVGGATGAFSLLVTKPQRPVGPILLSQRKGDGSTVIGVGATTDTNVVVFRADTLRDANARDTLRLQVELQFAGLANFDSVATDTSAPVLPGATATIMHVGLLDDSVYHWRARSCDQTGRCSGWADFGGNPSTATDFKVSVPQAPFAPTDSAQSYPPPGGTRIPAGGIDTTGTTVFSATVSDPDPGDTLRIQVERQTAGAQFTGFPNLPDGTPVTAGMASTLTLTGQSPPDNTSYRWQVRTKDKSGRTSAWVDFGGNLTGADYKIAIPETPAAPDSLGQFKTDGTPIPVGSGTGGLATGTVVFKAKLTDPDPGDVITLKVEAVLIASGFSGTANAVSSGVASGSIASASVTLALGSYHWRAQACDQTGRCSIWVSFGGNTDGTPPIPPAATDFTVP